MARYDKINYVDNPIIIQGNAPVDGRTVVTFAEMSTIEYPYVGMVVYVEDEKTTYIIKEGCLVEKTTLGKTKLVMSSDENVIRNNVAKVTTSDNILDMIDGDTIVGRPGPGIEKRYCLGTEEEADFSNFSRDDREPDGWTIARPEVTEYRPYVWSIEANLIYDVDTEAYVLNGVWSEPLRENGTQGERGDNFAILGTYASLDALKAAVTNPAKGEAYAVGTAAPYDIYIWDGTSWVNHGAIQGPKGDKGDPAWRSITKFVYKSTNGVADPMIVPATPVDGSYDFTTGEFVIPSGWQVIDSSLAKPIWMTSKTFAEDTSKASNWSTPIMISGTDGSAGEDGVGLEYAYKRVKTEADAPVKGPQSEIPEGGQVDGWYDNAQGVDDEYQCEYVVIRTGVNFEWSAWSTPVLWAKYGANGQDGDGVEYLYYVKNDEEAPINPTPKGFDKIESYNTYEFLPSKMGGAYSNINDENVSDYSKWSDNPHGVDKNNRYEFVAVRKKVNGAWKAYSAPKLWAKWSADGTPGEATSVAYIDNPMDSVLLDANGNVGAGLPCVTNFRVYKGSTEVQVTDLKWEADSADVDSSMVSVVKGTNKYATLTINNLKNNSSSKVSFKLTATADGKEYIGTFLINKISASAPNVIVDMGNDNVNVPCDEAGAIEAGTFPIFNTIDAFEGVDPLTITAVKCNTAGVSGEWVASEGAFKLTNITGFSGSSMTVSLTVSLDGKEDRNVSFRVIKVVPGAPGEAAVFYEIKPNIRYIKVLENETIADSCKTLTAKVIKHVGSEITEGNPSDFGMVLYYNVDSDSIDVSKTLPTSGLNLSNAVTGDLDLDRYISLTLRRTSDQKIIDGPERLYMVHDGTPGKDGKDGLPGEAGKGIKSTKVEYGISASATTEPSSWNTTTPTLEKGKYLWTRTTWTYTDNTTEKGLQKTYIPIDGSDGKDGIAGKDGVSIVDTLVEYGICDKETDTPTSWSETTPTLKQGSYLWTRTTLFYSDDDTEYIFQKTYVPKDGEKGLDGKDGAVGADGKGIKSTKVEYAISTSQSTIPTTGWSTSTPTLTKGSYLWTRTTWTYTDNATEVGYQKTYIPLDGAKGNDGQAGKDGVGIKSTKVEYAVSTSGTTAPTTGWSTSTPTLTKGKYIWSRTTWTYDDNTTETSMPAATYIGTDGTNGTNGMNAVTYRLAATDTTIRKSNTGTVKNTETITVSIYKIDGDSSTAVNVSALPSAYEVRRTYSGSSSTKVTLSSGMSITTSQMASATQYIKYELYYTQTGTSDEILVDSVVLSVVQDGPAGASGRIMYPAGQWVSGKTYTADETSTPYVFDPSGKAAGQCYFYLAKDNNSTNTTTSPYADWTANKNGTNYTWKVIPNYEVILADVGIFKTANVGAAAFYGDYVFSQTSTTGGTNFKDFAVKADGTIDTSKFNPAIWFNFKTGAGSLAKGNISWNANGKVTLGEDVELKWGNIVDAPEIGGEDGGVTAIYVETADYTSSSTKYLWTGNKEMYDETFDYYVWVDESDYDRYMAGDYVEDGDFYNVAFTVKGQTIAAGDTVIAAGDCYYTEGVDSWFAEGADEDITVVRVDSSAGLTADDVTGIIKNTEISANQIRTGTINANLVKVTNIDASNITTGKIGANVIDADNITVSKLDTKPSQTDTTGKITIEGNDMIIYNRSSVKPAIKISGDTLPNLSSTAPVSPGNKTYSFGGGSAMSSRQFTTDYRKIGTITVNANNDLAISPNIPYDLALEWSDGTEYGYHANVSFGLNFISSNQTNLFRSTMDFSFDTGRKNNDGKGIVLTGGDLIPVIDGNSGFTLMKGKTYDIYEVYFFEFEDVVEDESELYVNFGFKQYETSTSLVKSLTVHYEYHAPTDRISELGNDGIRFRQSPYEYFETCGNEMVIQDYHQAMGFNGDGLWMAVAKGDGSDNVIIWSKPRISNGTLTFGTSASTTYQNIRNTMFRH